MAVVGCDRDPRERTQDKMEAHVLRSLLERRRVERRERERELRDVYGTHGQKFVAPATWPQHLHGAYLIEERGCSVEYRRVSRVERLEGDYAGFCLVFLPDQEWPYLMSEHVMVCSDSGIIGLKPGIGD
jgi:hypothetical protein